MPELLENMPPGGRSIYRQGTGDPRPPLSPQCACGKRCFPSERAAQNVVLEARIARVIRHNYRRQEDRHYQCRFGAWHITSQPYMSVTEMAS